MNCKDFPNPLTCTSKMWNYVADYAMAFHEVEVLSILLFKLIEGSQTSDANACEISLASSWTWPSKYADFFVAIWTFLKGTSNSNFIANRQLLGYGKPASLRNIRTTTHVADSSGWLYHTDPTPIGGQELCLLPLVLTQPAHEWNRIMQTKLLAKKVSMHLLAINHSRLNLFMQSIMDNNKTSTFQ